MCLLLGSNNSQGVRAENAADPTIKPKRVQTDTTPGRWSGLPDIKDGLIIYWNVEWTEWWCTDLIIWIKDQKEDSLIEREGENKETLAFLIHNTEGVGKKAPFYAWEESCSSVSVCGGWLVGPANVLLVLKMCCSHWEGGFLTVGSVIWNTWQLRLITLWKTRFPLTKVLLCFTSTFGTVLHTHPHTHTHTLALWGSKQEFMTQLKATL